MWPVTGDRWQVTGDTWNKTQCSDVGALSRSKPAFLWKDQFGLIFHASLSKTNRFNYFITKSLWKISLWKLFSIKLLNRFFWTDMESNAAVTVQFKDVVDTNYLFSKNRPLGRFFHRVAMSVCGMSPFHVIFFEASHWPSGHMINSRPLIGQPSFTTKNPLVA